jgi:hypothetical protein
MRLDIRVVQEISLLLCVLGVRVHSGHSFLIIYFFHFQYSPPSIGTENTSVS